MNRSSKLALAAGALLLLGATAITGWRAKDPSESRPAPTGEPRGVFSILHAQPFVLEQGYTHWYRKE